MGKLKNSDIVVGMRVWTAEYEYASKGVRCTKNVEPEEVEVVSTGGAGRVYGYYGPGKAHVYISHLPLFDSKESATEYYSERLVLHVKHLLSGLSYFTSVSALIYRLNKYNLAPLSSDINDLGDKARDIKKNLENYAG
jgi:hypothetical protein